MRYCLKEMSNMEKPREKMLQYGASNLSDYELLAILLRTGTKNKSVIEVAIDVMNYITNLNYLEEITLEELQKIPGIGQVKAIELLATVEFTKRLSRNFKNNVFIKSSKEAYLFLKGEMQNLTQEHLVCIYLTIDNKIITHKLITKGTLDKTIINPRDVIKWGLKLSAYAIIMAHNHPSGNVFPSSNDIAMTKEMQKACSVVGIKFVDHIIIGKNCYYTYFNNCINNIEVEEV